MEYKSDRSGCLKEYGSDMPVPMGDYAGQDIGCLLNIGKYGIGKDDLSIYKLIKGMEIPGENGSDININKEDDAFQSLAPWLADKNSGKDRKKILQTGGGYVDTEEISLPADSGKKKENYSGLFSVYGDPLLGYQKPFKGEFERFVGADGSEEEKERYDKLDDNGEDNRRTLKMAAFLAHAGIQ